MPPPSRDLDRTPGTVAPGTEVHAHFLPVTRDTLTRVLAEEGTLEDTSCASFVAFSTLLAHVFHFLFHEEARALKRDYAPLDPDAVVHPGGPLSVEERERCAQRFAERFRRILVHANYRAVREDELARLLSERSPWSLRLEVDLDQFAQFCLYYRGCGTERRFFRDWRTGHRKRMVEYPVFRRLVLLARFQRTDGLPPSIDPDHLYLKLFKNIPRAELEMLFPNTRPQMKLLDKVKVAMPLVGGTGTTLFKILGTAAISLFAAAMIAVGFVGYAVKAFFGFLRVKEKYQGTLVSSLYFNSLDNNKGVIHHLIDQAEEEEVKEALLAYYFLLTEPAACRDENALDRRIERFMQERFGVRVDFEAHDALQKLRRLALLHEHGDGRLTVPPLPTALARLDRAWDGYFDYGDAVEEGACGEAEGASRTLGGSLPIEPGGQA